LPAARSRRAEITSVMSYFPFAANPNVKDSTPGDPAVQRIQGANMHAPANQPEFKEAIDPAVEELNRIVDQAEALLRSLGEETGDAAEAARERVSETLNQAKARLAVTASEAEQAAQTLVDRTDEYVRRNPWQAVAVAALLGGVITFLMAKALQRK
jgi:ElaB/YqjD/DUF883 family membrane-anchored ribosome-binding protein